MGLKKGLALVGTGDFTHPGWLNEIREQLIPAAPGLFKLRPDLAQRVAQAPCAEEHELAVHPGPARNPPRVKRRGETAREPEQLQGHDIIGHGGKPHAADGASEQRQQERQLAGE